MMRRDGQITVFLSLILLCICGLLCGLLESARMAGSRLYLQTALHSSMDSLFSRYHEAAWKDYRLFLLEYEDPFQAEELLRESMDSYTSVKNWYPARVEEVEITEEIKITDDNGFYLKEEIMDYMRYGVWELLTSEEEIQTMIDGLKEGAAVQGVAGDYGEQALDMLELEEIAQEIGGALNQQNELYEKAMSCLEQWDGSGFRRQAEKLKRELEKMPKLVEKYEKQADGLAVQLEKIQASMAEKQADMSSEVQSNLREGLLGYEEYISEDGQRRKEIQELESWSENQIVFVEQTMEEAEEVEEYLSQWEPSEEDEEPDYEALWQPVIRSFSAYEKRLLGNPYGTADKEKESLLKQLKRWAEGELLWLVLPKDCQVSSGMITLEGLPSGRKLQGISGENFIRNWKENPAERLFCSEYCGQFFTHFLTLEQKEFQYELEYILGGNEADRENLSYALGQILKIRQGLNLIYLLSDPEKQTEARQMAALIVGTAGFAPLIPAMTFFILCIWALGEGISDLQILLDRGKIPLWKRRGSWRLSLENLLEMGREKQQFFGESQEGFSYSDYLKMLLLLKDSETKYNRIMDLIQVNLCRKQDGFRMEDCIVAMKTRASVRGKQLFLSLWFMEGYQGDGIESFQVFAEKFY